MKRKKYLWVLRKLYTDGAEQNIEIDGNKYAPSEVCRVKDFTKSLFNDEPNLMAVYCFHVRLFPFGNRGFSTKRNTIYLNRAGLEFN